MDVTVDLAHLVGIKLSATQLNRVTTDLRARGSSQRTVWLAATDPESVTATIADVVSQQVSTDPSICAVGVSLAGPVSPRSEVVHVSPFWTGRIFHWSEWCAKAPVCQRLSRTMCGR